METSAVEAYHWLREKSVHIITSTVTRARNEFVQSRMRQYYN